VTLPVSFVLKTYTDRTQAQRNPEEEGDYMAFEQLMADAAIKKDKKEVKKDKKDGKDAKKDDTTTSGHHHHGLHSHSKTESSEGSKDPKDSK